MYEPPMLEIGLTLVLGLTLLSPYYRAFGRGLGLRGDERVLDYGSGSGICSRHIASRLRSGGGHLDCVDISRGWMRVIRKTLRGFDNVEYHLGSIKELDLPDAAFDVVVIHFVLHEIDAAIRPEVLEILANKLVDGGRLIMREPQGEGLTLNELRQLASCAGLEIATLGARTTIAGAIYDVCLIRP